METTRIGEQSPQDSLDTSSPPDPQQDGHNIITRQHPSERQTVDSGPTSRSSVAVACTACRNRHLKCDGRSPCGRCSTEGMTCSYVKSRRGWKGPRNKTLAAGLGVSRGAAVQPLIPITPQIDTSALRNNNMATETLTLSPEGRYPLEFLEPAENRGQLILIPPPLPSLPADTSDSGLVNAFYTYFFPAHPFTLPRARLLELLQESQAPLLRLALQFVGSFYVHGANSEYHEALAQQAFTAQNGSKDHFFVQGALLLAIGLHMADKEQQSSTVMYQAISTALNLGMNSPEYALRVGRSNPVFEECLRRTWWEIFVVDGMFAGVNSGYAIQLCGVQTTLPLPVEDQAYLQGGFEPEVRTLQHYNEAIFEDDDDKPYSSGTYRITAISIVQKVMLASKMVPPDIQALDLADTNIVNWTMDLPDEKRRIIDYQGQVDEVLFQAHMIISACTILLHRPRSDLTYEDVKNVSTCISGAPGGLESSFNRQDLHTTRTMSAARDICVLIKMPCPLVKHSPFFTCAITMAAVAYLSYWSFIATEDGDSLIKEHIRLNIGSLKTLATAMPIAKTVLGQVKGVAQELFQSRKALSNAYWSQVTREEILQGMIEDVSSGTATAMPVTETQHQSWDIGFITDGQH